MNLASLIVAASLAAAPAFAAEDHSHDFDFLAGKWNVHHHQLKERLAGNHDWAEFDGTIESLPMMNGHGNVDDTYINKPSGAYRALAIRAYDPKTQQWAIWWLDERQPREIEPPVYGNFQNGIGTFEGDDTFNGKPIKVRFSWSNITANTARWEQSFSSDGGQTWEMNWRMDLTRTK
jgi:hypothetical protein